MQIPICTSKQMFASVSVATWVMIAAENCSSLEFRIRKGSCNFPGFLSLSSLSCRLSSTFKWGSSLIGSLALFSSLRVVQVQAWNLKFGSLIILFSILGRWQNWPGWRSRIFHAICRSQSAYFSIQSISWHCVRYVINQYILDLLIAQVAGEHIKTCKAFELATRQRAVWVAALHRICLDNTLFLPSFPIHDMSNLELERAATAPHRWIELYDAFKKQDSGDPGAILCPRTTRLIMDVTTGMQPMPYIFLVPGGRYMVVATIKRLFVWDLGHVPNVYCTLIASVGLEGGSPYDWFCMVQVTPDEVGLIILVCNFNPL